MAVTDRLRRIVRGAGLLAAATAFVIAPGAIVAAPADAARRPERIPPAGGPIHIDGLLDEPGWSSALRLEVGYEVYPADSIAARVLTEVFLLYDDTALYAAFRAHDPRPHEIRARISDRDAAFQDDFVGLMVDTFNDGRRGFEFFVNALGVQMDLTIDDLGTGEDASWDAIWDSAGRITEDGYEVELAIPYTSLRFQRGNGPQTWGFDAVRVYPRDQRYVLAMNARDRSLSCYLCQVSKVTGFDGAEPGLNLEVTPTLTATRSDEADPDSGGGLVAGDPDYEAGVTARWGMTPNLTLSGAVNPDFSQVEADSAQLDVNERFTLFFPEKRPFFLEGSDFFSTPLTAVYTRTVNDPDWGIKVTGKEGRNAVGAFVARDSRTGLIFPGSQGSSAGLFETESSTNVLRYRRDLGASSALGALVTSREGDDYHNRVAGIDTLFRPGSADTVRIQVLASQTGYPDEIARDFDQRRGAIGGHAINIRHEHDVRNWSLWTGYSDIGRDFRADLGFIPRVDYRQPRVGYEYRWWGEPDGWYNRFEVGGSWDQIRDQDGHLIDQELETWYTFRGRRQSYMRITLGREVSAFRDDRFQQPFADFRLSFQPFSDIETGFTIERSREIDYAYEDPGDPGRARQGDAIRFTGFIEYRIGRHVRLYLDHELRQLDDVDGRLFRANLSQMRLVYQLNVRTFFRAILQHRNVDRDLDLYPACVADPSGCGLESDQERLFSQLLFSYKVNPQTAVFVGYSDTRDGDEDTSLTRVNRTLFFKVGYAWVR